MSVLHLVQCIPRILFEVGTSDFECGCILGRQSCARTILRVNVAMNLVSSNGWHSSPIFFKPEKNLEFFRLKNGAIDAYPGKLE